MKSIYKYTLKTTDVQELQLPKASQILTVQVQYQIPVLWALVDTKQEEFETRKIVVIGTGHPIIQNLETLKYISTYQLLNGNFIGHVFELVE